MSDEVVEGRRMHIPVPDIWVVVTDLATLKGASPGVDGVPYGVWGLMPILMALFQLLSSTPWRIQAETPTLVQLLVYVQKIDQARTAEEMRPLALPWTWIRIWAGITFQCSQGCIST